nr:hypothetical protein [Tanacetum cinerariifolium]
MENTMLELVKICQEKELYCMHDNVDDLIESALNFKLLSINSQRLNKEKQEVKNVVEQPAERGSRIIQSLQNFRVIHKSSTSLKNTSQISPVHAVAPILSNKEPEYSPSMGYEHSNTTPKTKSDEIIKSGVEELVPILNECEVTSEDMRECDLPVCENSPICDDHYEIFFDSNNDDDISSDEDAFEDIEYVEASLPDPEIKLLSINRLIANIKSLNDNPTPDRVLNSSISFPISEESDNSLSDNSSPEFETFCDHTEETRSGNTTTHANDSLPEYDSFCFEIEPDQERLTSVVKNDISDDSTNDPLLEEADLFLASDNSIPLGIENFAYDSEGDIHFLEEILIDDSIPFPNNESSKSDFDNPSFPRPPPKPPDADFDFELNSGEEISVVRNTIDELECLDPRDEFDDDDYSSFMFLIYSNVFSFLLFAESEDTIFDPGDVLNYAFLASRLQSASLQTKLLRHAGIVASGTTFDDALCMFNTKMETDLLSNLSVPLFSVLKPCSACSKVFTRDIYGDHVVSCADIIGIKYRHNVVRDTLVDICFRSGISTEKEVDIRLGGGYCMVDFVLGRAVIDASHRKRVKYEAKCVNIGYGFLLFSYSSLGELENDAVTLLKRIRKFSVTKDIEARAAIHIFNRISFAITKGVEAQLVSRLPTNFM